MNLSYRVIRNGYFVPAGMVCGQDLIYDENGIVVEDSVIRREKKAVYSPPSRLTKDFENKAKVISDRLIFLGPDYFEHYGHWITEGLSKYWILGNLRNHDYIIPRTAFLRRKRALLKRLIFFHKEPHYSTARKIFRIKNDQLRYCLGPVKSREIIVPESSIVLRNSISPKHIQVTQEIASHFLKTKRIDNDNRPVYLSRTRLRNPIRKYLSERTVENYCDQRGFKIIYPELLTLEQQIRLFNEHSVFIGPTGSAFHTVMFRIVGRPVHLIYLTQGNKHANYDLVDELMGNHSYNIPCLEKLSGQPKKYQMNVSKALDGISRIMDHQVF